MFDAHIKRFFWFLILCLAVLILFVCSVNYPLINKIKIVSSQYLANQQELAEFYQRDEIIQVLQNDHENNQVNLANLDGVLLDPKNTIELITDLEKIANQTNNIFEIKSIGQEELFLKFRINVWGDFSGFIDFLAGLEDTPYPPYRLIDIEDIHMRRLTSVDIIRKSNLNLKIGDLESTFNIKVYTK